MVKSFDTPEKFISQFNYEFCKDRYLPFRTQKAALFNNTIKIRELADCYDDETVQLWIEAWLYSLAMHMDFELSDSQAKETAQNLLEEIFMLNLTEITLFFRKLRNGYYGVFYNKFNMQTIMIAAREYRDERGKVVSSLPTQTQQKLGLI